MTKQYPDTHHDVTHNTLFGFWVYLMSDFILFASLFATYAVLQASSMQGPTPQEMFNLPLALSETIALLASNFTCALALLAMRHDRRKEMGIWFGCTFLLGILFLILVGAEFADMIRQGYTMQNNGFLASYFTLVGTHALHIVLGLLFLTVFLRQAYSWGLDIITVRRLNCFSMFWFFSYLVWIFMYTIVYLYR